MKRRLLILLAALLLAGGIGGLIARDPGYVLISWGTVSLETSLWFALVLLLAAWLVLRLLLMLLFALTGSGSQLRAWNRRRLERRAREDTDTGLLALAEGDWARARKELDRAARQPDTPLINLLGAARAAHELNDSAACDRYLATALELSPRAALAVGITRAELQLEDERFEQALATLEGLRREAPRNPRVLNMLRVAYEALEDWQELATLLPELRRIGAVGESEVAALERRVWAAELHRAARLDADAAGRRQALEQAWKAVPKDLRRDPELVRAQVRELIDLDAETEAEALLREVLAEYWDDSLVALYGQVTGSDPAAQLAQAEAWLNDRPNSAALLLALGRLALRQDERAKAREYLEASVAQDGTAEGHAELGRLLLELGEHEAASRQLEAAADRRQATRAE